VQIDLPELVTIGIPIYNRLEFLRHVLSIVSAQDYPQDRVQD